jgi:histone chaperone ASF1
MFIHITPDEFVEEFRESWKLGHISQPSIDYATNAIHVWLVGRDCILFNFKTQIPDYRKIPSKDDILGVTALIVTVSYKNQEFFRCGYYIYNSY